MIIIFFIVAVVLALILQRFITEQCFEALDGQHGPLKHLVEPDEILPFEITIKNNSKWFIPFVKASEPFDYDCSIDGTTIRVRKDYRGVQHGEFTAWLKPRESVTKEFSLQIPQRGRYVFRNFILQSGDLLGLKEESKSCGRFREVIVAPKKLPEFQVDETLGGFLGDVSATRFMLEDPVLTLGYRSYTGREPMKSISWVQSARKNEMLVKNYDYTWESTVSVLLNVDCAQNYNPEILETCFSMARTVCDILEKRKVKYSFTSNSMLAGTWTREGSSVEGFGSNHFSSVLEHLGRATYMAEYSAETFFQEELSRATSVGRILITPDGYGLEPWIARLKEASAGNLLVLKGSEVRQ